MDKEGYVIKGGKYLRRGYTTGTCCAAAAKAAAWMIKHQRLLKEVTIPTPKGQVLTIQIHQGSFNKLEGTCCVIKDSGDDPDITNGMEVFVTVRLISGNEILIQGGKGVGIVTQRGLQVPVGQAAINPTPLKMIEEAVRSIYSGAQGLQVVIDLPQGEELAKRTFNPKLGIKGGLSILGTTGILEPMSETALMETITIELKVLREKGFKTAILTPGNIGEKLIAKYFGFQIDNMVKISNYLGHAIEQCSALGFEKIIIGGHIGKLIKPAGGIYYTHNRVSSTRMEILTANLVLLGMKNEDLIKVMNCRTTDEATEIIERTGMEKIYSLLANKAAANCKGYCFDQLEVAIALFNMKDLLAVSDNFNFIVETF